ncbi:MAG: hypothetical protein GQ535_12415 [Rhodobacteraceae bacterium]|nr:hypothetical protein [Paracoccaceae bacterium]
MDAQELFFKDRGLYARVLKLVDEQTKERSIVDVALDMGASPSTIDKWVRGDGPVHFLPMVRLAALTSTSLDWLAYGDMFDRFIVSDACGDMF